MTGRFTRSYSHPMISITTRAIIAAALACGLAPLRAEETARVFDPGVVRRITPEEVQRRRHAGEKPIILDARASVSDVIIHGAVHVPNERIEAWAKDAPRDALIVAYCT